MLPAQWIESCLEFRDADMVLRTVTVTTEIDEIDEFYSPVYIQFQGVIF